MGKIIEYKISRWDGGIINDPRNPAENVCRYVGNFDVLTNPLKMTPYRDSEDGDGAASTSQKQNFCLGIRTGTTWKLFSLGVKSGAATAEVLNKALTTGGSADLSDNSWDNTTNNQSAGGAANFELFVYYKKTGKFYGAQSSRYIFSYDPVTPAWVDQAYDNGSAFAHICQGVVHPSDDILYLGIDNKIIKNDNGSFSVALTLPSEFYITSICPKGDQLAIALAPLSGIGNSRVIIWDRDASAATVSENISWGTGVIKIIEEIEGTLIGISLKGANSSSIQDKVIVRYLLSGRAERLLELVGGSNTTTLPIAKQVINNRLYFLLDITINGSERAGLWSIGRTSPSATFGIVHERTYNNDTAIGNGVLKSFFIVEDYVFISAQNNAGTFELSKTNDQANYTASAIRETVKFNFGDSRLIKKLLGVSLSHEPLPTDGQIICKYRKDEETSWTSIFKNTTDNSVSKSAVTADTALDGSVIAPLPEFKEIEFQILSTGNAEPTILEMKAEIVGKDLYD